MYQTFMLIRSVVKKWNFNWQFKKGYNLFIIISILHWQTCMTMWVNQCCAICAPSCYIVCPTHVDQTSRFAVNLTLVTLNVGTGGSINKLTRLQKKISRLSKCLNVACFNVELTLTVKIINININHSLLCHSEIRVVHLIYTTTPNKYLHAYVCRSTWPGVLFLGVFTCEWYAKPT